MHTQKQKLDLIHRAVDEGICPDLLTACQAYNFTLRSYQTAIEVQNDLYGGNYESRIPKWELPFYSDRERDLLYRRTSI